MPIKFECPHCNRKLTVADALAGKRGKCPACQQPLTIPATAGPAAAPAGPAKPEAAKPKPPAAPPKTAPTNKANPAAPPPAPATPQAANSPAAPSPTRNGSAAHKAVTPMTTPETPPQSAADVEAEAAAALADQKAPEAELTILEFDCEFCFEKVQMAVDMAGKRAPCPACRRIIKVPEPKKEKKDWRNVPSLPSGAKLPDGPPLDGAWDTRATARVSKESLEEAGALPDKTPPRTWGNRIMLIVVWSAIVGGSVWGGLRAKEWWDSGNANRALKDGMDFATGKDALTVARPESLAALHEAAINYYSRTGSETAAKDAEQQFLLGFGQIGNRPGDLDRDLVLIDLALSQVNLGGSAEEVDKGTRLKWEIAQKDVIAALKAIHDPQAQQEGVRLVGQRLIARKEVMRARALPSQVFSTPDDRNEALCRMALELYQAGANTDAGEVAKGLLKPYMQDKGRPAFRPSIFALAVKQNIELAKAKDRTEELAELIGRAEGEALMAKWEDAHKRVFAEADVGRKLQGQVSLATVAVEGGAKDSKYLDEAYSAATGEAKGNGDAKWATWRLVELGQKANWSKQKLQDTANAIGDPALRGRAHLALLRAGLEKSSSVDEKELENFDQSKVSYGLACLELAQHEARRGGKWKKTIENWQQPYKAFGSVGAALGMQAKKE